MRKFFLSFIDVLETAAVAVITVVLLRTFIVQPFLVSGSSMEPNFSNGNYLLVDELTYRFRQPARGEVVVFRYPNDPSAYFIKRVIGLPGEKVTMKNGRITVTGEDNNPIELKELYLPPLQKSAIDFETVLGPNEYLVLGDNRNYSFDSRNWGPLNASLIVGLARFRLWPVTKVMAFSAPAY